MEDLPEGKCDEKRPRTPLDKAMTCSCSQQPSAVALARAQRTYLHIECCPNCPMQHEYIKYASSTEVEFSFHIPSNTNQLYMPWLQLAVCAVE